MVFKENQVIEQRAHERFKVNTEAYVAFTPYTSMRGRIIDISETGLSFGYTTGENLTEKELMAILLNDKVIFLKGIWFMPVSDCEIKHTNVFNSITSVFSSVKERKCGGKFVDLTFNQRAKLEFFIKNYTTLT